MTLVARHSALSDIGLHRRTNEDAFIVAPPLYAVCDGMGGAQAGEVASRMAIETLAAGVADGLPLAAAAEAANTAVYGRAREDVEHAGMGTTLTAVLLEGSSGHFVHVGDSRAYLLRAGDLLQVSEDHSLVAEMVRGGRLSAEEAAVHPHRSILSRALGTEPTVRLDEFTVDFEDGDVLLLCSDGLSGPVSAAAIAQSMSLKDVDAATAELVEEALRQGGPDNITALVLRFEDRSATEPDPVTAVEAPDDPADEVTGPIGAAPDAEAPPVPMTTSDPGAVVPAPPPSGPSPVAGHAGRRRLGCLTVGLAAAAVIGLLGVVLLSSVFFVSVEDERLAVYSGLPLEIGPLPLHAVYRTSTRPYSSLSVEDRVVVDARDLHLEDGAMELARDLGMWP